MMTTQKIKRLTMQNNSKDYKLKQSVNVNKTYNSNNKKHT